MLRFVTWILVVALLSLQQVRANFFSGWFGGESDPAESSHKNAVSFDGKVLMTQLSQDGRTPLVGLGVGNAPHNHVGALVSEAIQDDKRTRLIDTASASNNEELIAQGILAGAEHAKEKLEVHVVTKIWYTHLGYERTKLSVQESLKAFEPVMKSDKVDLKVHFLLNWPQCYDSVHWMDCAGDENSLPSHVKSAGPDPTKDTANAWKESWKYLEDAYLSGDYPIESIGLSNFHLHDIEQMDSFARIQPQILQVSLWSVLYDSDLVDYCSEHGIHLQVYNALQATVSQPGRAPHAFHRIQKVANELSKVAGLPVTPAQVVLAWLVQHGITVIPRTSKIGRLEQNSGVVLSSIPALSDSQVEVVAHAVEAFLSGKDMDKEINCFVTFYAVVEDVMLYWVASDGSETRIDHILKGESFNETTYPNHVYRTYNAYNKDIYTEHTIHVNFGEHQKVYVDKFEHNDADDHHLNPIPHRTGMAMDSE